MTALAELALQGAIAQLVERVLCKHEVVGSIPSGSTIFLSQGFGRWIFAKGYISRSGKQVHEGLLVFVLTL